MILNGRRKPASGKSGARVFHQYQLCGAWHQSAVHARDHQLCRKPLPQRHPGRPILCHPSRQSAPQHPNGRQRLPSGSGSSPWNSCGPWRIGRREGGGWLGCRLSMSRVSPSLRRSFLINHVNIGIRNTFSAKNVVVLTVNISCMNE